MGESIKSKYKPSYPKKYKGDPNNIICRSSWERKFCHWCDLNENILEWGSEEFYIPYISPVDRRIHRYYPDFIFKLKTGKKYMVEIKPYRQCFPPKKPKKQGRVFMREQLEYIKNQAKWQAAKVYCEGNDLEFKIFTEKDIGVYN